MGKTGLSPASLTPAPLHCALLLSLSVLIQDKQLLLTQHRYKARFGGSSHNFWPVLMHVRPASFAEATSLLSPETFSEHKTKLKGGILFGSMRCSEAVFVEAKLPYVAAGPDSSHRQPHRQRPCPITSVQDGILLFPRKPTRPDLCGLAWLCTGALLKPRSWKPVAQVTQSRWKHLTSSPASPSLPFQKLPLVLSWLLPGVRVVWWVFSSVCYVHN